MVILGIISVWILHYFHCQKYIEKVWEIKGMEKLPFLQAIYLQCSMLRTWRYRKAHPTLFWRCQSQTNKQMSNLRAFIDFSWQSCTLMLSACNSICQSLSHFMFNHCNMKQNPVRVAHSSYSEGAQGKQTNKCPTFELLLTLADCRALWRWFCLQFRLSKFVALRVQSFLPASQLGSAIPAFVGKTLTNTNM